MSNQVWIEEVQRRWGGAAPVSRRNPTAEGYEEDESGLTADRLFRYEDEKPLKWIDTHEGDDDVCHPGGKIGNERKAKVK